MTLDIQGVFLLITGILLVVAMIISIWYYFSSKRKDVIEAPKYEMLKDDDEIKKN